MPTALTKLVFVASSFSPLLLVFALLDSWGAGWPTTVCLAVAGASWLGLWFVLSTAGRLAPTPVRISRSQRRESELLAYVATYFVPFLTVPADSPRKAAALAIFVLLIVVFYLQGEMYHWNPIIGLLRYRVVEATDSGGGTFYLMTRRRRVSPAGVELQLRSLSDNLYWEK